MYGPNDDKIIEVSGNAVTNWNEFQEELEKIYSKDQTTISLKVLRDDTEKSFTIEAYSAAAGANSSSPNYFRRGFY